MKCPLCQAANICRLFSKRGIHVFRCDDCTFQFSPSDANPNFAESIDSFESSYLHYLERAPDIGESFQQELLAAAALKESAGNCRILDVGCGAGHFVRRLRARGLDARGLEPCGALFRRYLARESHFYGLELGEFVSRDEHQNIFDVITLLDVIEHVEHPRRFIADLRRIAAPGCRLLIATPDVHSTLARMLRRYWHYYNSYHLSYFSPETLKHLLAAFAFRVSTVSHDGRRCSVEYLIRYFVEFVLGRKLHNKPTRADRVSIRVNLRDVMYVVATL